MCSNSVFFCGAVDQKLESLKKCRSPAWVRLSGGGTQTPVFKVKQTSRVNQRTSQVWKPPACCRARFGKWSVCVCVCVCLSFKLFAKCGHRYSQRAVVSRFLVLFTFAYPPYRVRDPKMTPFGALRWYLCLYRS